MFVLYTVVVLGGAFGISYAVFEWRDDDVNSAAVFGRWEDAWDKYMDTRQDAPDPPPRGSSETAWNRYSDEFAAAKAHNELAWEEYEERVKDCYP